MAGDFLAAGGGEGFINTCPNWTGAVVSEGHVLGHHSPKWAESRMQRGLRDSGFPGGG